MTPLGVFYLDFSYDRYEYRYRCPTSPAFPHPRSPSPPPYPRSRHLPPLTPRRQTAEQMVRHTYKQTDRQRTDTQQQLTYLVRIRRSIHFDTPNIYYIKHGFNGPHVPTLCRANSKKLPKYENVIVVGLIRKDSQIQYFFGYGRKSNWFLVFGFRASQISCFCIHIVQYIYVHT